MKTRAAASKVCGEFGGTLPRRTHRRQRQFGLVVAIGACLVAVPFAAVVSAVPVSASPPYSTTLYVNASTGTAITGCTSPGSAACQTITEGVTAAEALSNTAVTVDVAAGTYDEEVTVDVPVADSDTLTIQGAGAATTILNDGGTPGNDIAIGAGTVTIDGLTISGASTIVYPETAGGVNISGSIVTLDNDTISGDSAGDPEVPASGGGVYAVDSIVTLDNDVISHDSAETGGGVFLDAGTATLDNDAMSDDSATAGGGVAVSAGTATLDNDTFSGDSADYGGGVNNAGTSTLDNDTFSGDSASDGGGVYNVDGVTATLDNDTISGDFASSSGGGIYDAAGSGGIIVFGTATLENDTISGDSASSSGGGIYSGSSDAGEEQTTLANSILADNFSGSGSSCAGGLTPPVTDDNYNVADDASCGFGSKSISNSSTIGLLNLAANGSTGPETEAITATSSPFNEVPISACALHVDERGLPRPGAGNGNCDAGAFELQGIPQTISFTKPGTGTFGGTATLSATGGGSGKPVVFSVARSSGAGVCKVSGTTARFTGVGTCVVDANQAGNGEYDPAPQVQRAFAVRKATSKVALKLSTRKVTYGDEQGEHLSVTVSPQYSGSSPTGNVTINESTTTLCTITLSSGKGSCTLKASKLRAGTYGLVAKYGGSETFRGSTSAKETLTVVK
jgi:hypothetical protein